MTLHSFYLNYKYMYPPPHPCFKGMYHCILYDYNKTFRDMTPCITRSMFLTNIDIVRIRFYKMRNRMLDEYNLYGIKFYNFKKSKPFL